ncbi:MULTISPECIES: GntR family transcriptional regulator [unclassified Kribbella]|uniref:GntR family transcriptional regulator n=1 Tax=unclassified Kribbella TaxID=2644121 RepID=UPI0034016B90
MTGKNEAPTRIPRATFATMVGERIRASIIEGELAPGTQLSEVELAARYGVSRGPVREALQRLIQEGLLLSEPHHGVSVPVMSTADFEDIYLVRLALETAALRKVMSGPEAVQTLRSLERVVRQMRNAEESGDWQTVAELDMEFHTVIVSAAHSPRLDRVFHTVISETRLCLGVLVRADERRTDLVDEHEDIVDRMRAGDFDGTVAVLKKGFEEAVVTLTQESAAAR